MAYQCVVCGKGAQSGHTVSHSNIKSKTRFMPNLHRIKVNLNGVVRRARLCASCIRTGKVQKVK